MSTRGAQGLTGKLSLTLREPKSAKVSMIWKSGERCLYLHGQQFAQRRQPKSWKPLQQGWKKREKKEPRPVADAPPSFGDFIRAHAQGCFVCHRQNSSFQHDHPTCPTHKAHMEPYKKAHHWKKRAPAHVREAKVEVSKDDPSKLMMVGNELAMEIQQVKRAWAPKQDKDNDKDKDNKGKGRWMKKGDGVHEDTAEDIIPNNDTP